MEALNNFEADCARFPTTAEGLSALVANPGVVGWKGPYWEGSFPDRWGGTWRYENTGGLMLRSTRISVTRTQSN